MLEIPHPRAFRRIGTGVELGEVDCWGRLVVTAMHSGFIFGRDRFGDVGGVVIGQHHLGLSLLMGLSVTLRIHSRPPRSITPLYLLVLLIVVFGILPAESSTLVLSLPLLSFINILFPLNSEQPVQTM